MSDLDSVIQLLITCKTELGNDEEDRVVHLLDLAIKELETMDSNPNVQTDWNEVLLIFGKFLDSVPAIAALIEIIKSTLN